MRMRINAPYIDPHSSCCTTASFLFVFNCETTTYFAVQTLHVIKRARAVLKHHAKQHP